MIQIVTLGKPRPETTPLRRAFQDYVRRAARYVPTAELFLRDEAALLQRTAARSSGASWLVLLDPKGKTLASEELAQTWRLWRDSGKRQITLAVGPADGWSPEARLRADFLLSLGPMTLPHELAAVVAAEQVYRVLTILAGHPYHCGH